MRTVIISVSHIDVRDVSFFVPSYVISAAIAIKVNIKLVVIGNGVKRYSAFVLIEKSTRWLTPVYEENKKGHFVYLSTITRFLLFLVFFICHVLSSIQSILCELLYSWCYNFMDLGICVFTKFRKHCNNTGIWNTVSGSRSNKN